MEPVKRCSRCKEEKPLEQFSRNRPAKDGLFPWCKACKSQGDAATYQRHRESRKARMREAYKKRAPKTSEWFAEQESQAQEKHCPRCQQAKPLTEFRQSKSGYQSYCKDCVREYLREWVKNHPERVRQRGRESWLRTQYGLEPHEYQQLLESQGGGCAICGARKEIGRKRRLPVDHDAVTGEVRGILCTPCNRAIGQMHHDPRRLLNAAIYLRRSLSPAP